ncbi:MAG: PIG-L deacetylase family protein [Dehalococcoidia bacterium]|nr:PIG-L deacetylase family protein [Dehalococcoidia bacterium]
MPTLLAFIAHPDDESYAFAGTLALAARAGWFVLLHCATHGEGGERYDGGPETPSALADTREEELRASCTRLRIEAPDFWGLPDGGLAIHRGEQRRIQQLVERHRPDLLIGPGPDGAYGHPDHIALHRWVLEAWQGLEAPPPLLFPAFSPGLFVPQWEKCVAAGIMGDPPIVAREDLGAAEWHYTVDIRQRAKAKREAIAAHASQLRDGDPLSLFPGGIVERLLDEEHFTDARGTRHKDVESLLDGIVA